MVRSGPACAHFFARTICAEQWHRYLDCRNQDGSVVDAIFDLYNQAFALLAYACGHRSLDPSGGWQSRAYTLVQTLKRDFAHPGGGLREDRDVPPDIASQSAHASARGCAGLAHH